MMRGMIKGRGLLAAGVTALLALAGGGASVAAAADAPPAINAQEDPGKLIQDVAGNIFKELDAHRADYRANPAKLKDLITQYLLPYFDTQYAAQLVLGKAWRSASAEQRQRFIDAFQSSLLKNYGTAIVEFQANRLKVFPSRIEPSGTAASVRSEITLDNGSVTPVVYALRKTDAGWKAWDVQIEGISYVVSFRKDFAGQIEQSGLDAVIQRLESGAVPAGLPAPGGAAKPAAGK